MFSIRGLAVLVTVAGAATLAAAQSERRYDSLPRGEAGVSYSYMRANATPGECGCFSLNGGSAEAAIHAFRNFSIVADLAGSRAGTTSVPGQSLSLVFLTGGPRFSYPLDHWQRTIVVPFVQGLGGGVHGFDAPFPHGSTTLSGAANGWAVWAGGGLDLSVSHRLRIRAVQVDYGFSTLPNAANNSEHLLRVSTGIVFRIR